jgi:exopolysaccharide biosynthesis polyprenyl glycosylphosphotransferase
MLISLKGTFPVPVRAQDGPHLNRPASMQSGPEYTCVADPKTLNTIRAARRSGGWNPGPAHWMAFSRGSIKALLILGDATCVGFSVLAVQQAWGSAVPRPWIAWIIVFSATMFGLYLVEGYESRSLRPRTGLLTRLLIGILVSATLVGAASFAVSQLGLSRRVVASLYLVLIPLLLVWRLGGAEFLRRRLPPRRVSIVGDGEAARDLIAAFDDRDEYSLASVIVSGEDNSLAAELKCRLVQAEYEELPAVLARDAVDLVAVAIPEEDRARLFHNLVECRYFGIEVQDVATCIELLTQRLPVRYLEDGWVAFSSRFMGWGRDFEEKLKRLADLLAACIGLLMAGPLMLLVAVAVRMTSSGPVLFRQERVGRGGETYTLLKFRSMREDSEGNGAVWATVDDARATTLGALLRRSHLDELPQLWNVLRGEMSLVGPRPERPEFVQLLRKAIPYYDLRHVVKPGITGWAQVSYPYGASVQDAEAKLEFDLYYIRHKSLLWDARIMLQTITVSILGRGSR